MKLGTNGLQGSVLAVCHICFLKTINYLASYYLINYLLKYLFGINGLKDAQQQIVKCVSNVASMLHGQFNGF